jgi:hypothetical protein
MVVSILILTGNALDVWHIIRMVVKMYIDGLRREL